MDGNNLDFNRTLLGYATGKPDGHVKLVEFINAQIEAARIQERATVLAEVEVIRQQALIRLKDIEDCPDDGEWWVMAGQAKLLLDFEPLKKA